MAARLEATIRNREKVRLGINCSVDKAHEEKDEERGENTQGFLDSPDAGRVKMLKELFDACRGFFKYMNSAISEETDVAERFKSLKLAKNLAVELI